MDLSAKGQHQQHQRNMNVNSVDRAKSSNLSKVQQMQQQQVVAQMQAYDMLSPFGGDLGAAVAALAASNAGISSMDNSATLAQINALAQLKQLAASNPNIAAAAMLQFQLGSQSGGAGVAGGASLLGNSMSQSPSMLPTHQQSSSGNKVNHSRYQQLLSIVDEMSKDIRNTYLGNKNSTERLKRGIASARILVKDCQLECERNTKQ